MLSIWAGAMAEDVLILDSVSKMFIFLSLQRLSLFSFLFRSWCLSPPRMRSCVCILETLVEWRFGKQYSCSVADMRHSMFFGPLALRNLKKSLVL